MNTHTQRPKHLPQTTTKGFSLIELMIAIGLGAFVIVGVIGIFTSTQQANRTTEGVARAQETQRTAFELMARSIREAGGNYCGRSIPITTNIAAPIPWWKDANFQLRGFDQGVNAPPPGLIGRIAVTDAIRITSASLGEPYTLLARGPFVPPAAPPANFVINRAPVGTDFAAGSFAFVCDYTQGSLFTSTGAAGAVVNYAANPALPLILQRNAEHAYMLAPRLIPATLTPFHAESWFIRRSAANALPVNRSLYRQRINGGTNSMVAEEILENVTDMQITYSRKGTPAEQAFVPAAAAWTANDWNNVIAVRVELTLEIPSGNSGRADDPATADIQENRTIQRKLNQTILIRSRN